MMKNSRTKIELLQFAIIIGDSIWWDKEEGGDEEMIGRL